MSLRYGRRFMKVAEGLVAKGLVAEGLVAKGLVAEVF
jgi:hypothetical protein